MVFIGQAGSFFFFTAILFTRVFKGTSSCDTNWVTQLGDWSQSWKKWMVIICFMLFYAMFLDEKLTMILNFPEFPLPFAVSISPISASTTNWAIRQVDGQEGRILAAHVPNLVTNRLDGTGLAINGNCNKMQQTFCFSCKMYGATNRKKRGENKVSQSFWTSDVDVRWHHIHGESCNEKNISLSVRRTVAPSWMRKYRMLLWSFWEADFFGSDG